MPQLYLRRFKIPLIVIFLICITIPETKAGKQFGKAKSKCKKGHVHLRKVSVDTEEAIIDVDGESETVQVKKMKMSVPLSLPSDKTKTVSAFSSEDSSITCMRECSKTDARCEEQCMQQRNMGNNENNGQTYISKYGVLVLTNDNVQQFVEPLFNMKEAFNQEQSNNGQSGGGQTHTQKKTRRMMIPNKIKDIAMMRIRCHVDVAFMEIMTEFVGGDLERAKKEAEFFALLTINNVNHLLETLSNYGNTINSTDSSFSKPLRLGAYLESMDYPTVVNGSLTDLPAFVEHKEGEIVVTNLYYDQNGTFLSFNGSLLEMSYDLKDRFDGSSEFNHFLIMTGCDIAFDYYYLNENGIVVRYERVTGIVGVASQIGAVCEDYQQMNKDLRYTYNEMFSPVFSRIATHEVGHIVGAPHDQGDNCGGRFHVMSPLIYSSLEQREPSYYSFSECSARDIANYLSSFTGEELMQCLYTSSPTKKEFLKNFCKGFLGTRYSPEDHCKLYFGSDSHVCTYGNTTLQNAVDNGYLPYDRCQYTLVDNVFSPIFLCSNAGDCINSANRITHLFEATKCQDIKGKTKKRVCFQGECVKFKDMCKRKK